MQEMMRNECDHEVGGDRGGVRAGAPSTKAAALSRHSGNRSLLDRIMRSGRAATPDPTAGVDSRVNLLHNSVEWIDAGYADLVVLTPTHDSELRPSVAPDKMAYFDTRKKYNEDGGDYDASLDAAGHATNDAGLDIKFAGVLGSLSVDGTTMTLVDPLAMGESTLVETLIHEVQHDADQHRRGDPWAVDRPARDPNATVRAPKWAYNSYQSEFRAYWMENPEGSSADNFGSSTDAAVTNFNITAIDVGADNALGGGDDTSRTVTTVFANKRQEDIFRHMFGRARADNVYYDGSKWTQSYAYLSHYYALDPAFKAMVDAYDQPVSGNLINSPRIQALSDALASGVGWRLALADLEPLDFDYLSDTAQSQPFWDQATAALAPAELQELTDAVDDGTPYGPYQESVTVVSGDTLSALADRYLNASSRWREIYAMNRSVIGADPDRIEPGQRLRMPQL